MINEFYVIERKNSGMDPMWTRKVKPSQRKLDPLGLSRVSQWLTEESLPGITTVTSIARNYSFYYWESALPKRNIYIFGNPNTRAI